MAKTMTLAELMHRAAVPQGKRKPFAGLWQTVEYVRFLQHAADQILMSLADYRNGIFPADREHEPFEAVWGGWMGTDGIDRKVRAMGSDMASAKPTITKIDIMDLHDQAVALLGDLVIPEVPVEQKRADGTLQWYYNQESGRVDNQPGAEDTKGTIMTTATEATMTAPNDMAELEEQDRELDGELDAAAEQEQTGAEAAEEALAEIADIAAAADVENEPDGEDDAGDPYKAAWLNLAGVEMIRLGGVEYRRDPLSSAFGNLPAEELGMLTANLKATGQKLLISLNEATGTVIDGWQRLCALEALKLEPDVVTVAPDNPVAYVMALNVHRRGTQEPNAAQRTFRAADLFDADRKRPGARGRKASAKKIADAAGVSTGTVEQVRLAIRWDKDNNSGFEAQLRSGKLTAKGVYDKIMKLKAEAVEAEAAGAVAAGEPAPEPAKPAKLSRADLEDTVKGLEEQATIDKEEHDKELAAERDVAAAAQVEAERARATVETLKSEDATAKRLADLEEQNAAYSSRIDSLQGDLLAEQQRKQVAIDQLAAAEETIGQVRTALTEDDREALYELLNVAMPAAPLDEDDPFGED